MRVVAVQVKPLAAEEDAPGLLDLRPFPVVVGETIHQAELREGVAEHLRGLRGAGHEVEANPGCQGILAPLDGARVIGVDRPALADGALQHRGGAGGPAVLAVMPVRLVEAPEWPVTAHDIPVEAIGLETFGIDIDCPMAHPLLPARRPQAHHPVHHEGVLFRRPGAGALHEGVFLVEVEARDRILRRDRGARRGAQVVGDGVTGSPTLVQEVEHHVSATGVDVAHRLAQLFWRAKARAGVEEGDRVTVALSFGIKPHVIHGLALDVQIVYAHPLGGAIDVRDSPEGDAILDAHQDPAIGILDPARHVRSAEPLARPLAVPIRGDVPIARVYQEHVPGALPGGVWADPHLLGEAHIEGVARGG